MAGFCRKCGSPIGEGARFCRKCGTQVRMQQSLKPMGSRGVQQRTEQRQSSRDAAMNHTKQQQNHIQNAAVVSVQQVRSQFTRAQRDIQQTTSTFSGSQSQFTQAQHGMTGPAFFDAMEHSGETTLRLPDFQNALGFANEAKAVLSPFAEFFRGVSGFFKGIFNVFRDPKALTFSAVLTWVWIVLIALKQLRIGGIFTDALSWATFAHGGLGDGVHGLIGGIFGKIAVASGFFAIINGPKNIGVGIKKWFGCFNASSNTGAILMGAGISLILYNFFVANAKLGDTMVAVSGFILALRALGSQNGFIFGMARSLMSGKSGNIRRADDAKASALISGIGTGAMLAIPLSVLPFGYIHYIIGTIFFVIGMILHFALRGKEVRTV